MCLIVSISTDYNQRDILWLEIIPLKDAVVNFLLRNSSCQFVHPETVGTVGLEAAAFSYQQTV